MQSKFANDVGCRHKLIKNAQNAIFFFEFKNFFFTYFQVKDMKEARIDEVLESIATTPLVHLPDVPLRPKDFYEENMKYGYKIGEFDTDFYAMLSIYSENNRIFHN